MFSLTLLLLAQAGGPQCLTVGGTRVCGYDCKDAGGKAACAETIWGVCDKGAGPTVTCFDPPVWLSRVASSIPRPSCIWRGARAACGYDCKAQGDSIGCATTPRGTCIAQYNKVVCADPPAAVYGVYGLEAPKPTCEAKDSMIACGYGCTSSGSTDLRCAATPFGTCAERGGKVECFDPDEQVICAELKSTTKPECKYGSGMMVCGYHCVEGGSAVSCAKTPGGSCDAKGPGAPVCFDPPVKGGNAKCLSVLGTK